jgi:A/G-specific adenine glycosylase
MSRVKKLQEQLLGWYAKHKRVMPWRALSGRTPDPYHVWLSEIMLQQTTVAAVGPYFTKFITKWPGVQKLAVAELDDVLAAWAGLGYYARARNLHKCAQVVSKEMKGKFPVLPEELLELPGIGPYTAAAISSIAFNQPAVAVDGNVERVVSRFFAVEEPLPKSKEKLRALASRLAEGNRRPADFTQAFMELGATICTPKNPKCTLCPWQKECKALKSGIAEELPRKTVAAAKPVRYGKVYWIQKETGEFLIEKRKGKGLYEGMYQLPTTEWVEDKVKAKRLAKPYKLKCRPLNITVRHSFTHFDLVLEIWHALPDRVFRSSGRFVTVSGADKYALPSLMHKVVRLCAGKTA